MHPLRDLTTALLALVLTACIPSLVENPPRDARDFLPVGFAPGAPVDGGVSAGERPWSEFFSSPELRALVQEALVNNQELNHRLQELIIAQAEVSARQGELFPKVRAGLGAGVDKVGSFTSQGAADEANGLPANLGRFGFGLSASWELDVWGRLRNARKAADSRALAAAESRDFLVTQLVAELARSYFELIALDNEVLILQRNIGIQTSALEVVKVQKEAARVTELAVQRFEAEVLKNRARLFDLEQERVQVENRINFLVGRTPRPVARDAKAFDEPLPKVIEAGLPSALLENRPDVKQAQLELEAARLDVSVARANFFPALSIEAAVGYQSFNLAHLVATPQSLFYNLAGNLTAPLLNRAAIEAQYRTANARQLQAVLLYERTVLQAVTDVLNQLARFENLHQSYALGEQQVARLNESVEVSGVLFQSARADYMEVLLTRRDSLDAQLELLETKKRMLLSMVGLYQALGGGWRTAPRPTQAAAVSAR